jgi:nucleotide-binding universal stress UspA family protein
MTPPRVTPLHDPLSTAAGPKRLGTILAPIDGSALAEQAVPMAADIARRHGSRLELAIVHAPTPFDGLPDAPWNAMNESMQDRYAADRAAALATGANGIAASHALLRGDPAAEIARRARAIGADLIVMATHGRTGFTRALAGSVADAVIREAGVPVLVLRQPPDGLQPAAFTQFSRMLILSDGSAESREIVDAAIAVATPAETSIRILRVIAPVRTIPDPSLPFGYLPAPSDHADTAELVGQARAALEALTASVASHSQCLVDPHLVLDDHTEHTILQFIKDHRIDLIAMTTHGRGASRLVFGSIADAILRATNVPMLVLRPVQPERA